MVPAQTIFRKVRTFGPVLKGATVVLSVIGGLIGVKEYIDANPSIDVSGQWVATNRIDQTHYKPFQGLTLPYHIYLEQDGKPVHGTGEKWAENGKDLPTTASTPVTLKGLLDGSVLKLSYTEVGAKRTTIGQYRFDVVEDGKFCRGTFSGTAANSSGPAIWERRAQF